MSRHVNRTIVLESAGPASWASHQDITPALRAVWDRLDFKRVSLYFPNPVLTPELVRELLEADQLVFPLGSFHVDALTLLERLRTHGFQGRALIMCAGDGVRDQAYLRSRVSALRSNDVFITNCPAEKRVLERQLGEKIRIETIPLPLLEAGFAQRNTKQRKIWRREHALNPSTRAILYAGRISAQKNILSLLAVFKNLLDTGVDAKLYIAGSVDDFGAPHLKGQNTRRYIDEVVQFINEQKLGEHVSFLGFLDQAGLAIGLQGVDAFATLSLHASEDFGYAAAQAVAAQVPTVVTSWGGGEWFCDSGFTERVSVWLTKQNGVKIAYDEALASLQTALSASEAIRVKRATALGKQISIKAVAKTWAALNSPIHDAKSVRFSAPAAKSSLPFTWDRQNAYRALSISYGARKVDLGKSRSEKEESYLNPLWNAKLEQLQDPLGFTREYKGVKKSSHAALDEGIRLPGIKSKRRG